jgi:hypothetical protein
MRHPERSPVPPGRDGTESKDPATFIPRWSIANEVVPRMASSPPPVSGRVNLMPHATILPPGSFDSPRPTSNEKVYPPLASLSQDDGSYNIWYESTAQGGPDNLLSGSRSEAERQEAVVKSTAVSYNQLPVRTLPSVLPHPDNNLRPLRKSPFHYSLASTQTRRVVRKLAGGETTGNRAERTPPQRGGGRAGT